MQKDSANITPKLFSYRPYWAKRFGVAPFLPMSRDEMDVLGWDSCDIILVTGDAYVDHPSFGMSIIGRLLEAQGFRVGIISQPNWQDATDFQKLGKPNLFFGITAGNMDSMVNHYTAERRIRSDDAYTPCGVAGKRPDRAAIVYAQRCREAFREVPIILGGIEASLRRLAHYDYWSDTVRRSILIDAKADLLVYGNGERAIIEISHRISKGEPISALRTIRGTAFVKTKNKLTTETAADNKSNCVTLPAFETIKGDTLKFAEASHLATREFNPWNAKILVQKHDEREVWVNPPALPLSTEELDQLYELPYQRKPHPSYAKEGKIPADEMIRFSIPINRGCFGGCSFCAITEHEGRTIQSRSPASVLREIASIKAKQPDFTGVISDLGGPTANMYQMYCKNERAKKLCRRRSCIYPRICGNLNCDHLPLIELYRKARSTAGIKKVLIGSGVRYDLALKSPEYIAELTKYHTGGYLKVAPEHTSEEVLKFMLKPPIELYEKFKQLFEKFSKEAGKEQYLIPYFIGSHPGTTDEDMINLALWLKKNNYRLEQVQNFLPTPMTIATTMYHTSKNPMQEVTAESTKVVVTKSGRKRRLYKAFLRYHVPENWPIIREALYQMGRTDLIGYGKRHLVPPAKERY